MVRAGAHTNTCRICLQRELRELQRRYRSIYRRPAGEWEPWMPLGGHLRETKAQIDLRIEQLEAVTPTDELDRVFDPIDAALIREKRRRRA